MRPLRIVLLVTAALLLQGCVTAALTAGGIAASAGIDHTLSGIAYKTFAAPLNNVRLATLRALDHMDMDVSEDQQEEAGWTIVATARERTIDIELEALTSRTTRMRVVANQGSLFMKDPATSTEIIVQTARALDDTVAQRDGENGKEGPKS